MFWICSLFRPELQKNALALLNALFLKANPEKKKVGDITMKSYIEYYEA